MWKPSLAQTGQTVIAGHDPLSPVVEDSRPHPVVLFLTQKNHAERCIEPICMTNCMTILDFPSKYGKVKRIWRTKSVDVV